MTGNAARSLFVARCGQHMENVRFPDGRLTNAVAVIGVFIRSEHCNTLGSWLANRDLDELISAMIWAAADGAA